MVYLGISNEIRIDFYSASYINVNLIWVSQGWGGVEIEKEVVITILTVPHYKYFSITRS